VLKTQSYGESCLVRGQLKVATQPERRLHAGFSRGAFVFSPLAGVY
jgi:hypothetical protein